MPSIVTHAAASDGTELLVRHWIASPEPGTAVGVAPWASVLLVHGLGEHSGRYEDVGHQLTAAGLDVHAYDHRGFGRSGGRRGHVDRWEQYHDDLAERLAAVRASADGRHVVLYGHSMGGLVVLGYLLTERPKPDLVVLSSPALDSTLASWKKALVPKLSRIVPTLTIPNGIDGSTLSRDPAVAAKVGADPLATSASTIRFGAEGLAEQARVNREYRRLAQRTLVLHGLDDGLVPARATEILGSLPNVERRTYPGLRHELHNEPEGPAIVAEIIDWIRDQTGERATIPA